jgi:uncharacterized membrane protein required for colicin V production
MFFTDRLNILKGIVSIFVKNVIKNMALFLIQILGKLFSAIKGFLVRSIHKEQIKMLKA